MKSCILALSSCSSEGKSLITEALLYKLNSSQEYKINHKLQLAFIA